MSQDLLVQRCRDLAEIACAAKNVADMLNMLENGWTAQEMLLEPCDRARAQRQVFDPQLTLIRRAKFSKIAKPTVFKAARPPRAPGVDPRKSAKSVLAMANAGAQML